MGAIEVVEPLTLYRNPENGVIAVYAATGDTAFIFRDEAILDESGRRMMQAARRAAAPPLPAHGEVERITVAPPTASGMPARLTVATQTGDEIAFAISWADLQLLADTARSALEAAPPASRA